MQPNIFTATTSIASITAGGVTRFWPFGSAPDNPQVPYATWQTLSGTPDSYLSCIPDADDWSFQVDVWGTTPAQVRNTAKDIRNALQVDWNCDFLSEMGRDFESHLFRYTLRFSGRQSR